MPTEKKVQTLNGYGMPDNEELPMEGTLEFKESSIEIPINVVISDLETLDKTCSKLAGANKERYSILMSMGLELWKEHGIESRNALRMDLELKKQAFDEMKWVENRGAYNKSEEKKPSNLSNSDQITNSLLNGYKRAKEGNWASFLKHKSYGVQKKKLSEFTKLPIDDINSYLDKHINLPIAETPEGDYIIEENGDWINVKLIQRGG